MKNQTKKCHYISQTYLKNWSNNNTSLNIYDKSENREYLNKLSIENNFYEMNLYNYKFELLFGIWKFKKIYYDFKNKIKKFERKHNLKIYYKGKKISLNEKKLKYLLEEDNITFYRNGVQVITREKNNLYNTLKQLKSTYIEDKLCEMIENKWNNLINKINNQVRKNCLESYEVIAVKFESNDISVLRLMFSTMLLRIKNTPGFEIIENSEQKVYNLFYSMISSDDDEEFHKEFHKFLYEDIKKISFLHRLYELVESGDFKNFIYFNGEIVLNFELYCIENDMEFYTSDVPCFLHINNFEKNNDNFGIYFPISPKLLIIAKKDSELSNYINFHIVNKEEILYFNNIIINNARKYVIFKDKYRG